MCHLLLFKSTSEGLPLLGAMPPLSSQPPLCTLLWHSGCSMALCLHMAPGVDPPACSISPSSFSVLKLPHPPAPHCSADRSPTSGGLACGSPGPPPSTLPLFLPLLEHQSALSLYFTSSGKPERMPLTKPVHSHSGPHPSSPWLSYKFEVTHHLNGTIMATKQNPMGEGATVHLGTVYS